MQTITKTAKIGDWLVKRDPIYRTTSQGNVTKVEGDKVTYFDANAFDGFGGWFDADINDPFVTVTA